MTTRTDTHLTRVTWGRIAGLTFLLYIVIGITQLIIGGTSGDTTAEKLAYMAQNAMGERIDVLLNMLVCFIALTLGLALYAVTREFDHDLAMLALLCRVGESLIAAVTIPASLGLLSFATAVAADPPT